MDLADGVQHERAAGDDHCLVGWLVVEGISEQTRDRLVILSDDDDTLAYVHKRRAYLKLHRR